MIEGKDILDACCGSRMFWFDKKRADVLYMDIRNGTHVEYTHENGTVSEWNILPDIQGDFRKMPFDNESFSMVVFDPPHTVYGNPDSFINAKYGLLDKKSWKEDLRKGFTECMRVLKDGGFLIFKWSECNIRISELKGIFPNRPMFGQKTNAKTMWLVFRKDRERGIA